MIDFDPTGAGATLVRLAANSGTAGALAKESAAQKKLQEKAYQVSDAERNAGLVVPVRTIGSDQDFRKCMSDELTGMQPIQRGVGGNSSAAIGDLGINLANSHYPVPGTVTTMERTNAHAGGGHVLKTDQATSTPPPKMTVTGGGCGSLPQTDLQGRFFYSLVVVEDSTGNTVGYSTTSNYILMTPNCVASYLAALPPLDPGYSQPALVRVEYHPPGNWTVYDCS